MTSCHNQRPVPHVLLYEPRVEGHHVSYLKFITEDLLSAGYLVSAAIDGRPAALERIRSQMAELLELINIVPLGAELDSNVSAPGAALVARCLQKSGADLAFLNSFDEIASSLLRRAALGRLPPPELRTRLGGIYLRPRFATGRGLSLNRWLKAVGFSRLARDRWFSHLLLLDPGLAAQLQGCFSGFPIRHLPDPYPEAFVADATAARRQLAIPDDRFVFLFYGGAYRRKGLPLAVEAMTRQVTSSRAFLLCAGQQDPQPAVARLLESMVGCGRARVINRFVSAEEEKLLFAASDVVLLPYIKHFGSSGVLSRAAGAGRPVIASNEELVGRLVGEHGLGWLFSSGDARSLAATIHHVTHATLEELAGRRTAAVEYAPSCSRAAFRAALLETFSLALAQEGSIHE